MCGRGRRNQGLYLGYYLSTDYMDGASYTMLRNTGIGINGQFES